MLWICQGLFGYPLVTLTYNAGVFLFVLEARGPPTASLMSINDHCAPAARTYNTARPLVERPSRDRVSPSRGQNRHQATPNVVLKDTEKLPCFCTNASMSRLQIPHGDRIMCLQGGSGVLFGELLGFWEGGADEGRDGWLLWARVGGEAGGGDEEGCVL